MPVLGVFAAGAAGSFKTADYDLQQSMVAGPLKESIAAFGEAFGIRRVFTAGANLSV